MSLLLPRSHFYLSVFVASLGIGMPTYFIPLFAQKFGATYLDLGIIGTVWGLATAITPLFAGHLADRMNHAWVFSLSLTISTVATAVLGFSHSVVEIAIFRLFGGFGMGFFWPTAEVMVTDLAPANKRVKEMGRYLVLSSSGLLIGPLIGGLVVVRLGYIVLFLIASATIGISFIQVIVWVIPTYRKGEVTVVSKFIYSGYLGTVRRLFPWYAMLLCYGVLIGFVTSILPGYANSVGITAAFVGFLFSALNVTRIFSYANADRYLKFGEKRTLFLVSLMISVGILTLTVSPIFIVFLLGIMLIGGCMGGIGPIAMGLISRHFPPQKLGAALASYETAINMGYAVGPYLAGILASVMSVKSSFVMMSFFGVFMALCVGIGRTYSKETA